jgi:hypothetical protein
MPTELPMQGLSTQLVAKVPIAGLNAATALADRRGQAIAEYWRGASAAREPSDLLGVQLVYWSRMLDDYGQALTDSLAPLTAVDMAPAAALLPEPAPAEAAG